jgi:hypothetical protein
MVLQIAWVLKIIAKKMQIYDRSEKGEWSMEELTRWIGVHMRRLWNPR